MWMARLSGKWLTLRLRNSRKSFLTPRRRSSPSRTTRTSRSTCRTSSSHLPVGCYSVKLTFDSSEATATVLLVKTAPARQRCLIGLRPRTSMGSRRNCAHGISATRCSVMMALWWSTFSKAWRPTIEAMTKQLRRCLTRFNSPTSSKALTSTRSRVVGRCECQLPSQSYTSRSFYCSTSRQITWIAKPLTGSFSTFYPSMG
mmetsp:Transcript_62703/g.104355  ORF Transcript_62703/g.104355 Transcript_62703/m.104355 type:complete len:201 (-) Transcript_62703:1577-2179(-)